MAFVFPLSKSLAAVYAAVMKSWDAQYVVTYKIIHVYDRVRDAVRRHFLTQVWASKSQLRR